MGLLTDILKEIPQAAVLKEKIASIEAKYAAADTENAILKDDLRKAQAEIAKLRKQVEDLTPKDDLNTTEQYLIVLVARNIETGGKPAAVYSQHVGLKPEVVQIYLDSLYDRDYLSRVGINGDTFYDLTPKAREYILKNKLL
jgi:hypothetical protein